MEVANKWGFEARAMRGKRATTSWRNETHRREGNCHRKRLLSRQLTRCFRPADNVNIDSNLGDWHSAGRRLNNMLVDFQPQEEVGRYICVTKLTDCFYKRVCTSTCRCFILLLYVPVLCLFLLWAILLLLSIK